MLTLLFNIILAERVYYTTDPSLFTKLSSDILQQKSAFVKELVSNSKDAIKKTHKKGTIIISLEKGKFIIKDDGIGMSNDEVKNVIGCVGKSLTNDLNDDSLIGKFGLGLYSVFKVGDKTIIRTKKENERGVISTLYNSNYIDIEDFDKEEVGTEIEVFLKEGVELSVKEIEDWVREHLMANELDYEIRMIKTEDEIAKEKEDLKKEYVDAKKKKMVEDAMEVREKEFIEEEKLEDIELEAKENENKDSEEKKEVDEDVKKEEEKKKAEKEKKAEELKKARETKRKEAKEKITKEIDGSFELTPEDELNILTVHDNISLFKVLETAPWTDNDDFETLKKIYTQRYKKSDLKYATKVNFSVKQKNIQNISWENRFDALIFVPENKENMFFNDTQTDGAFEVFISDTKLPINIQLSEFLKPFYFIIKSNEANLTSTRESFYDSENTNKNLINALSRKLVELFISKEDKEIHDYSKLIKRGYLEYKKANNHITDKMAGILTFDTNFGIKNLNNFFRSIEEINEKIEAKNKGEEKVDDNEKTDEHKEKSDDKDKIEENKETSNYDKKVDYLYYTNISMALTKEIDNPLFDGIKIPFLYLNDIHDEEIVNNMKSYKGLPMKNIITQKFEFKEIKEEEHKETIKFIKDTLKDYVSEVIVSKRLQKYPFSIITNENAIPSTFKAFFGDNKFDNNFMREYFDPKPTLEVNVESKEFEQIALKKDKNAVVILYLATCVACKIDPYNKVNAFANLMDAGRTVLGLDEKLVVKKNKNSQFDMFKNMGMDMGDLEGKFNDLNSEGEFDDDHHEDEVEDKVQDFESQADSIDEEVLTEIPEEVKVDDIVKGDNKVFEEAVREEL